MLVNRSIPRKTVMPELVYPDDPSGGRLHMSRGSTFLHTAVHSLRAIWQNFPGCAKMTVEGP